MMMMRMKFSITMVLRNLIFYNLDMDKKTMKCGTRLKMKIVTTIS